MAARSPLATERFRDRAEAGRELARRLERYRGGDAVVLGLARGGVPVAAEVARSLGLPLDVFVVRKLGVPQQPELAVGAVASGGLAVVNDEVARAARLDDATLRRLIATEAEEVRRRERAYRDGRPPPEVNGRTVILVDDGLATGASMLAAARTLGHEGARKVVVAVPVAPPETCEALATVADEVVCARTPERFVSVGSWYEDFRQTSDDEVRRALAGRDG
jgi:putative phosphoribosyl transferase